MLLFPLRPLRYLFFFLLFALLPIAAVQACGPTAPYPVFAYGRHPDLPLVPYAAGRLDVVQPGYARLYLLIAWRYWSGKPLTPAEQKEAVELWKHRIGIAEAGLDPVKGWMEARGKVKGAGQGPEIELFRQAVTDGWYWCQNCLPDAFHTAVKTLNERIAAHGAGDPGVADWLAGQDRVFALCGGEGPPPAPAAANAAAWLKADRAYQQAAALYYGGKFPAAAAAFQAIAADPASPWAGLSRYLIARVQMQAGEYEAARTALEGVLADPNLATYHPAAKGLRDRLTYLEVPNRELRPRFARQAAAGEGGFLQLAGDYLRVLDDFDVGAGVVEPAPEADPLSDWLLAVRLTPEEGAFDNAWRQWQASPTLPWLMAVLMHLPPDHPKAAEAMKAAAALPADSPAFATALYYRLRHLMAKGQLDEARTLLAAIPADDRLGPSARNLFATLRTVLADGFDRFAAVLPRPSLVLVPDSYGGQEPGRTDWCRMAGLPAEPDPMLGPEGEFKALDLGQRPLRFDPYSVKLLNEKLPLALLDRLSTTESLPAPLRDELRRMVWVRALLLGDETIARRQAEVIQKEQPKLAAGLADYLGAKEEKARGFAATRLILRTPGLSPYLTPGLGRGYVGLWDDRPVTTLDQIENYRDNWWCGEGMAAQDWNLDNPEETTLYPAPMEPAFLTPEERAAASKEFERLKAQGTAPNYLAKQAIQWAEAHPKDDTLAETLHLAVRATRYGCTDDKSSPLSKRAHQLLHKGFPKSEWAKKTPYWF